MAVIKCKMCGGDLNLIEGQSVAECEYCRTRQTVPSADSEKKLTLFARAERLRKSCEFDKAAGIYEAIVADFSDEAEAYWGMVLCKYGIEYVDDPATGKRIPTCHRSSFDSVMDDSNFEQAMENADEDALRVYRQEAKQIEAVRKGILEVSSNEQPYDIFICYKETDSSGNRTVDSLLAQDIYDVLTEKGYRVFFSRITLEDKLGQAYEPYIFAALNSAKIMLAVGTCYEHYNAVWVKNEWSRYLKIIAQDKNKYLIPCYKGIDAYDMPKQFVHLQGQDMGKVGAIQDLLRGIEKILPKQDNTTVIQERVVVGGSGTNKIATLLERGNMALEDGDWAKADSFFEEVLNNDAQNTQAYIGKILAKEKNSSLDALADENLAWFSGKSGMSTKMSVPDAHVDQVVAKYMVPEFLEEEKIRALYKNEYEYTALKGTYHTMCVLQKSFWNGDRQLVRALKFAKGEEKQQIEATRSRVLRQLDILMAEAEAHDKEQEDNIRVRWSKLDDTAERMYREACANRERSYQNWVQAAKNETTPEGFGRLASKFASVRGYRDSVAMMQHCQQRQAELMAERRRHDAAMKAAKAAEDERRRIAEEKEAKARKTKALILKTIVSIAVVLAIAVVGVLTLVVIPGNKYSDAQALMQKGQYEAAALKFEDLGKYKDSHEMYQECQYQYAQQLYADRDYEAALVAFEKIQDYKDSADYYGKLPKLILMSKFRKLQVGETVTMGAYNAGRPNNPDVRDIEWIVLDIQDGRMLLLANNYFVADCYHDYTLHAPGWEKCTLRSRLNNEFLNKCLNEQEQELLVWTVCSTEPNPQYGITSGPDTKDKVFILSYNEVMKYLPEPEDREYGGYCWWLRTAGKNEEKAMCINEDGTINMEGQGVFQVDSDTPYLRPAVWIDISEPTD